MIESGEVSPEIIQKPINRLENMIVRQKKVRDLPVIAGTDIDNTLLLPQKSNEDTRDYLQRTASNRSAASNVIKRCQEYDVPIVTFTGRPLEGVIEDKYLHFNEKLPFTAIFSAVGTEFAVAVEGADGKINYTQDPEWENYIEQQIGFKRDLIYPGCRKLVEEISQDWNLVFQPRDLPDNVKAWQDFREDKGPKPANNEPQRRKISFQFDAKNPDDIEKVRNIVREKLKESAPDDNTRQAIDKLHIVISHEKDKANGGATYNMDIVPITKKGAAEWLMKKYGCEMVYADDSENGMDALKRTGGVAVGNRKPGLDEEIDKIPALKTTEHFIKYTDPDSHSTRLIFRADKDQIAAIALKKYAWVLRMLEANSNQEKASLNSEPKT